MSLKYLCGLIFIVVLIFSCSGEGNQIKKENLPSDKRITELRSLADSINYMIGVNLSQQFSFFNEDDYRPEKMNLAVQDFIDSIDYRVSKKQRDELLQSYFRWARQFKKDSLLRASEAFLTKNVSKPGILTTPRGIQYTYLKKSSQESITPDGNDAIACFYKQGSPEKGFVWDLKKMDIGQDTASFALNQMYSGISEVCQLMRVGDRVQAWIPPRYGSSENDDPLRVAEYNEVVYVEIEILDITERSSSEHAEELRVRPGYFIDESRRKN